MAGRLKRYSFVNAKIRTRLGQLLSDKKIDDLLKCRSIEEVASELQQSRYANALDIYSQTGDIRAVEFALLSMEIETLREIASYLDSAPADYFRCLVQGYEVDMLKNALRYWFDRVVRGDQRESSPSYLYRDFLVHRLDFFAIAGASSSQELLALLEGTPYQRLLQRSIPTVEQNQRIFELELELDTYYYRTLAEGIRGLDKKDRKTATGILQVEVDLQNIDRIVRFAAFYKKEERQGFDIFLPGGSISPAVLRKAYSSDDALEALELLLEHGYRSYRIFKPARGRRVFDQLNEVELLLRRILQEEARRLLWGYPFSIGTLLAFVFLTKKEIDSIIKIVNAKYYGLTAEAIREVL
ncbi:MAG TPA: hypothetical protein ENN41_09735 [Sediminispirochaeta sp.]|nr:hypothetical protein [Sediminispirochaeta sp.]